MTQQFKFDFDERLKSDRGETGPVVGRSEMRRDHGREITRSYRIRLDGDSKCAWVPEKALSLA